MISSEDVINTANEFLMERHNITIRSRQIRAITEALCMKINEELDNYYPNNFNKPTDKELASNKKMKFINPQ
jgi:methionine aminopeptidase